MLVGGKGYGSRVSSSVGCGCGGRCETKFRVNDKETFQIFRVPIVNKKITRKVQFHLAAPLIKYHQKRYNSCYFSSLASGFYRINGNRAVNGLIDSIEK